jgi:hypothetical protein
MLPRHGSGMRELGIAIGPSLRILLRGPRLTCPTKVIPWTRDCLGLEGNAPTLQIEPRAGSEAIEWLQNGAGVNLLYGFRTVSSYRHGIHRVVLRRFPDPR